MLWCCSHLHHTWARLGRKSCFILVYFGSLMHQGSVIIAVHRQCADILSRIYPVQDLEFSRVTCTSHWNHPGSRYWVYTRPACIASLGLHLELAKICFKWWSHEPKCPLRTQTGSQKLFGCTKLSQMVRPNTLLIKGVSHALKWHNMARVHVSQGL